MRGFAVHRGRCKEDAPEFPPPVAAGGEMQSPPGAAAVPPLEGEAADDDDTHATMDISPDGDGIVPEDAAAETYVLGSAIDDMLGRLYMKHSGLTVSLLKDIMRITTGTASCAQLFKRIDALPGRCFNVMFLRDSSNF